MLCSRNKIRHSEFFFFFPKKIDVKAIWNRALLHLNPQVCFLHNIMLTPKACFIRLAKKSIYFTRFILRHPTCMDVSFHKKTLALECLKTFSNNVKCVKVRYAKILLSSDSLFALSIWIVMKTMNMYMGTIQQPYYLLSTSFISQMSRHNTLQITLCSK